MHKANIFAWGRHTCKQRSRQRGLQGGEGHRAPYCRSQAAIASWDTY